LENGFVRHYEVALTNTLFVLSTKIKRKLFNRFCFDLHFIIRAIIKKVNKSGHQISVRHIVKSIQHIDPLVRQLDEFIGVTFLDFGCRKEMKTMSCNKDVPESINFQQIAIVHVEPKSSHRKRWFIFYWAYFFGVSEILVNYFFVIFSQSHPISINRSRTNLNASASIRGVL